MFEDIMLDLETLDNSPTSVIVAIGAVRFNPKTNELGDQFYRVIDGSSCQQVGMTVGVETVCWWMQQSEAARRIFHENTPKETIQVALLEFTRFIKDVKDSSVWGNGSTFDNIILRHAYRCCQLTAPWSFRRDFCFRTLWKNFPAEREQAAVRHNALDDAKAQAVTLMRIIRRLRG